MKGNPESRQESALAQETASVTSLPELIVKVKYNGPGGWEINYAEGKKMLLPGQTIELNAKNKEDLRVLITAIKNVNAPERNTRTILNKGNQTRPYEYVMRWEISPEELAKLPEDIRRLKYGEGSYIEKHERTALMALVPDYFQKEEQLYKLGRGV